MVDKCEANMFNLDEKQLKKKNPIFKKFFIVSYLILKYKQITGRHVSLWEADVPEIPDWDRFWRE